MRIRYILIMTVFLVVSSGRGEGSNEYSIVWHTIDGGGGTSSGGVYSVSGTIGQADADYKSIFEQWKKFRDDIQPWHSFNETDYNVYIASQQNF